jgi:hypothetical protein
MSVLEVTNIKIYRGCDFEQDFQLSDESKKSINLSNCEVIAKIKKYPASKNFNTFDVQIINSSTGLIRLLMSNTVTGFLSSGRNYFDIIVVYPSSKIKPVVIGTIMVEDMASTVFVPDKNLGDLGNVNTSDLQDGDVLMYKQDQQELDFVNPDEVLDKSAEDGLPETFTIEVTDEIENRISLDSGEY